MSVITTKNQSLSIVFLIIAGLFVGCQKQNIPKAHEQAEQSKTQKTATASEPSIPTTVLNCDQVDANIAKLKKTYTPEGLVELNEQFRTCLASVPLEKRYEWLEASDQVYGTQIEQLPISIVEYISLTSRNSDTSTKENLKNLYSKMNTSEQYVIDNLNALYFYPYNLGEGDYSVSIHPQYQLEIFAPYLDQAGQVYLQENTKQNNEIDGSIDKDAGLSVSFSQLSDWIIFWENYLKQYPNNNFKAYIKNDINIYQKYLFLGLENTPIFEFNDSNFEVDSDALKAITKLSKTKSSSAEKAKKFLKYVHTAQTSDLHYDEKTGTQQEYNLFMSAQLQKLENIKKNYEKDLTKQLDLK